MPVKKDLLEILCCPQTKVGLRVMTAEVIEKINSKISAGQVQNASGDIVKDPMEEALITIDNKRIYAVKDSIPIMLVDESIATDQFSEEILALLSAQTSE